MNIVQIEDALYSWINNVLGVDTGVIFAYPNAPRPSSSYALINVYTNSSLGHEESISVDNGDGTIDNTYSESKTITASVNLYYSGAYQKAITLSESLSKVTVYEALYGDGLGLISITPVQKIPEQIDQKWEERAQFDVTFTYRSEVNETIETIKQIEIEGETYGEAPPTIITAKSVVFDFADNHGDIYNLGIRSLEFYLDEVLIEETFVADASSEGSSGLAEYAFDTSLSKIGTSSGVAWSTLTFDITNQRLIVIFDSEISFDKIIYNNFHSNGGVTSIGVQNTKIYTSDILYSNTNYGEVDGLTNIFDGVFEKHKALNEADDQTITF